MYKVSVQQNSLKEFSKKQFSLYYILYRLMGICFWLLSISLSYCFRHAGRNGYNGTRDYSNIGHDHSIHIHADSMEKKISIVV